MKTETQAGAALPASRGSADWKRDYAILIRGQERHKIELGRACIGMIERQSPEEDWTVSVHGVRMTTLKRRIADTEEAMRVCERLASKLLNEALSCLPPNDKNQAREPSVPNTIQTP